jgi:hypothetical protein
MPDLVIRQAVQHDIEALWDFLAMAAHEPDAEAAKAVPSVAKYLVGWQRPGDFGFIADQNGETIGAAWARRFSDEELKFPYGGEERAHAVARDAAGGVGGIEANRPERVTRTTQSRRRGLRPVHALWRSRSGCRPRAGSSPHGDARVGHDHAAS